MNNSVVVEEGAKVSKTAIILGNSHIKKGAIIEDYSKIINSVVEEGARVSYSIIEDSHIKKNAKIGNFSYIHTSSVINENAVIGHSVEIKKSNIGENTHIKHLTYVGDTTLGKNVNIGACCVFANYDGKAKHPTLVEDDVFIGSGSVIVAPLTIKKGSFIAAGSTITDNVESDTLAIARSRQINKENYFKN